MNEAPAPQGAGASPAARRSAISRFCDAVDAVNAWTGLVCGFAIAVVTGVVIWEVVARGMFASPTVWANETTVYLSAVAYLVVGGYALLHRRHVRIDVIYERLAPRTRAKLDLFTFVFFVLYAGTLVWIGGDMAWASIQQGETTGTPWSPPIWPVKLAIPVAGLLLLLQGTANLLRDLGIATPRPPE
jgi:TRAP-type mannitol/chloroaromatic compound transport system permease small subunit